MPDPAAVRGGNLEKKAAFIRTFKAINARNKLFFSLRITSTAQLRSKKEVDAIIPVLIARAWRRYLLAQGPKYFEAAMRCIGPWSIAALLLTLVLLCAFQGEEILQQPRIIALLAVPIRIQVLFNSGLAYLLNRAVGESRNARELLREKGFKKDGELLIDERGVRVSQAIGNAPEGG